MLLEPFLRRCRIQPEATALLENDLRMSYGELNSLSLSLAAALQGVGIGPGRRVAIHLERGIHAVAALFGTLLAGACYLPLDLKNPPSRLNYIIRDAEVSAVMGRGDRPAWLEGVRWLDVTTCPPADPSPTAVDPAGLAIILYTSGSTGQPKGVAFSHQAVAAFVQWAANLLDLCAKDRIASSAPLFFDLSTFDLYAVLGCGASLHCIPPALTLSPSRLGNWLRDQAITGWYTVPSLLAFLAYKGNLYGTPLPNLRFLVFAGEVFATPALIKLAEKLPATRLYNFFGPTETNVCCYWPVDRNRLDPAQNIPIGRSAGGDELQIDGATGELWVRGPTLASGYWSGGCLHSFCNPTGWYATGDRVSRNALGEYLFHGRLGRMLKCSGYRVEPAEIEAVAMSLDGVNDCAVVGIADPAAGQRPALIVALAPTLGLGEVRQALLRHLPAYMQPARCLAVDALPRLPNGKVDYQAVLTLLDSGTSFPAHTA